MSNLRNDEGEKPDLDKVGKLVLGVIGRDSLGQGHNRNKDKDTHKDITNLLPDTL